MCGRLRAGGQRHPILPERRHLDPERATDLRPGPVSDSGQPGQRQGDVHGRGLQVSRFVRVQVRVHDCGRRDQASFIVFVFVFKKIYCSFINVFATSLQKEHIK